MAPGPETRPLLGSLLAVLSALAAGSLFLVATGQAPFDAFRILGDRGFSSFGATETAIKSAPLLLISAGLLVALRAGVWNIGIDGQVLVGALVAGASGGLLFDYLPQALMLFIAVVAGAIGGMLWTVIPAMLKIRFGLNEIITTIMMNFVAIYLTSWLVKGPLQDPAVVPPQTVLIPRDLRLWDLPGTRIHSGLLLGLGAVLFIASLFRLTSLGMRLWVVGQNPAAARHAGLRVGQLTAIAFLTSGALAGLAGANDVLGVKGMFQGEWNPAYGFTAFAVVFLARSRPLLVIPFAMFLAFMAVGADFMPRAAGIPTSFVELLEGFMLIGLALAIAFERGNARMPWLYRRWSGGPASQTPVEERR
ncbi:MAG: ABC transporter permease [Chloroflexota bacterium]|nr:ABC transporter permease [Chloroflexota bacterium]